MRPYLLDTTPLNAYLQGRALIVALVSPWIVQGEAATSILVYGEVVEYLKGRPDFSRRHADLLGLLDEIPPYFLSYAILERYADIRRQLRPPYGPRLIGDIDTLIATTALQQNLVVVTMDSDFQRVPNLQVMLLPRRP